MAARGSAPRGRGGSPAPPTPAAGRSKMALQALPPPPPPVRLPSLRNAPRELRGIQLGIRNELIDCLDSIRGNKALVIDQKLLGPLGLLTEFAVLREHFVEKVHPLAPGRMDTPCANIIYMCRPKVEYMKYIAEHIKTHNKESQKKHYSIFFVPRGSLIAQRVLEEEGVFGDVTTSSWNMDLVPFDDDLISLELENSFRDCFLEGDPTSLYYVARSVMKLQDYFGQFPKILGIGDSARQVKDMVLRMSKERAAADEQTVLPQVESLVLIDRQVDMATPLATQMTFEGLIDELIGINCSLIEVEAELLDPDGKSTQGHPPGKKLVYPLNSNDLVYSEFRDQNIEALASLVRAKAKGIQDSYDQLQSLQSLNELRGFVTTLPVLKQQEHSLGILNNIAHKITSQIKNDDFIRRVEAERSILSGSDPEQALAFISEMIDRQMPLIKVLRLLCLFCIVHGGLTPKHYELYQREIVHAYGYDTIFTMHNLARLGLFRRVATRSPFQLVHKPLQLFCPDAKKVDPDDIAHVFSGYAPLSVRLVQYSINPGWRAIPEHIRSLGAAFEVTQSLPPAVAANLQRKSRTSSQRSLDKPPMTVVFFIGGVTFAEIAALRLLGTLGERKRDFLIVTTKMITGDSLINSLIETLPVNSDELSGAPPGSSPASSSSSAASSSHH